MQKRMSTTLRAYKKQLCRAEWSDAKDVVSRVCLTYIIVDQIQTYSRYPVRNNRGKAEATKEAIWTFFLSHHCQTTNQNTQCSIRHCCYYWLHRLQC